MRILVVSAAVVATLALAFCVTHLLKDDEGSDSTLLSSPSSFLMCLCPFVHRASVERDTNQMQDAAAAAAIVTLASVQEEQVSVSSHLELLVCVGTSINMFMSFLSFVNWNIPPPPLIWRFFQLSPTPSENLKHTVWGGVSQYTPTSFCLCSN
jgi:hypothetical protein